MQPARLDYLDRVPEYDAPATARAIDEGSYWSAQGGRLLLRHVPLRRDLRFLDLGTGTGFPLFEVAHACGPGCRAVGADVWAAGLARAATKQRFHGHPGVSLARADGARLPFADGSFDLIVSNFGVNNFADPPATIRECARVLRPGGALALVTNVAGHYGELYDAWDAALRAAGETAAAERLRKQEAHRLPADALIATLDLAGFEIVQRAEDAYERRYASGEALLRCPLTRLGFLDGWRAALGPDHRDLFPQLQAALDHIARERGEIRVTVPLVYLEGQLDRGRALDREQATRQPG